MVRRGSTVRVRQRASESSCWSALLAALVVMASDFDVHRASTTRRERLPRLRVPSREGPPSREPAELRGKRAIRRFLGPLAVAPILHGKGVDGSSPSEGFSFALLDVAFVFACGTARAFLPSTGRAPASSAR